MENKYHAFIGFCDINGDTAPVYFDKVTRKYKTLDTNKRTVTCRNTKENYEVFYGMDWEFLEEEDIKVVIGNGSNNTY